MGLTDDVPLQWTHLQFISFAIAHVVLLVVHLLKRRSGGAIANESTVKYTVTKREVYTTAKKAEGSLLDGH